MIKVKKQSRHMGAEQLTNKERARQKKIRQSDIYILTTRQTNKQTVRRTDTKIESKSAIQHNSMIQEYDLKGID